METSPSRSRAYAGDRLQDLHTGTSTPLSAGSVQFADWGLIREGAIMRERHLSSLRGVREFRALERWVALDASCALRALATQDLDRHCCFRVLLP